MSTENTFTLDELSTFDDATLLSTLKECWKIEDGKLIKVWGRLENITNSLGEVVYCKLENVKTVNNNIEIEYPIIGIPDREKIQVDGVHVPKNIGVKYQTGDVFKCELILSSVTEREKRRNPMVLTVNGGTLTLLNRLPIIHKDIDYNTVEGDDKNLFIEGLIIDSVVSKNTEEISAKNEISEGKLKKQHENKIEQLKLQLEQDYFEEKGKSEHEIISLNTSIKEKENTSLELERNISLLNTDIEKKNTKKENLKKKIEGLDNNKKNLLDEIIIEKKNKVELLSELEKLTKQLEQEEELMSKRLERFREFVKDKADTLLALEFIDQHEYDDILMLKEPETDPKRVYIDFHTDLNSDYSKAVSHIQAYLFKKGIMYPKYIIEEFFALVQTNDLIILAGESGSGKTNLVKSFAEAVGGVYKIIPVKPNWTSSEDLLGYYNPLEKKYLSTPFLDALMEANKNPDIPYFICLDEMNLARVEYYFADFLSLLEDRNDNLEEQPEIHLYSDSESAHILSEFKNVLELIKSSKEKYKKGHIINFVEILQDEEINRELKRVFGFSDKDSLIKYHTDLRRMLTGVINTPSSIKFPKNVRLIGAINIDETTHYLSPKIIDRAHIMKFESPLLFDWKQISSEISSEHDVNNPIEFDITDFGTRGEYPPFNMNNDFCKLIVGLAKEFFTPLGVEVGLRTIRQGLNYQEKAKLFNTNNQLFINNFFIHKILPKMTFDGNKQVANVEKKDLLANLNNQLFQILNEEIKDSEGVSAIEEFNSLIRKAEANDWIVNYWA